MEFVAIPKSDFLKYFKIIEPKKGSIRSLKSNELEIKKVKKRRKEKSREHRSPPPTDSSNSSDSSE